MNELTREQYEELFKNYPDVVTLNDFRDMLGGISYTVAYKLMRGEHVEHFVINTTYYIPKECVIDYLLTPHYRALEIKLKHHISIDIL